MDNFNLIDLDKVLDEFEKTEEDPVVPAAALTWPRGADKRSSPPSNARPVPVTPPRLDGAAVAPSSNIRPSSLKVQPAAHFGSQRAAACVSNSDLNLPDDQTSVSSGYDSLRTSSEFIVASQEFVLGGSGLNLAASAVPEEITPTVEREDAIDELASRVEPPVEEEGSQQSQLLPAVALDNYALRPDLVHESAAAPAVDLVAPVAFAPAEQEPEVDEAELNSYLGLEAREEPEGTEETLPDVAASCNSGAEVEDVQPLHHHHQHQYQQHQQALMGAEAEPSDDRSKASSTPDIVDVERALGQPDLLHDSADSPGHDAPCSMPPSLASVALVVSSPSEPTMARASPTAEKRLSETRAAAEGSGMKGPDAGPDVPKKKARPNTLLGLVRPTPPSEVVEESPNENPLYNLDRATLEAEEEMPKPRRPTWLALPSRSVSTDSGGGTSSSTLTPGPPGSRVSPMSEDTMTPSATENSPHDPSDEMDVVPTVEPMPDTETHSSMDKMFEEEAEAEEEQEEQDEEPAPLPVIQPLQSGTEPTPFSPDLGRIAPIWVHDRDAPTCMGCSVRFTLTRRRHHCRACGKVFCSMCCSHKAKMQFLDGKEARVCAVCFQHLIRLESSANRSNDGPSIGAVGGASDEFGNPTSALRGSRRRSSGGRNVVFADGIRPGGDLSENDASARVTTPSRPTAPSIDSAPLATRPVDGGDEFCFLSGLASDSFLPVVTGLCPDLQLELDPDIVSIAERLSSSLSEGVIGEPVRFAVTRHLHVLTQRVRLSCCVGLECWTVSTRGLATYGQAEIVIVLQSLADEILPPLDLFRFLHEVYTSAKKGETFTELSCFLTGTPFLGSKENAGFLFLRPTYQCLEQLPLPDSAQLLVGVLIQRWEAPLAKLFPLRLLLRLGHQHRYYPCPVFSTRDRGPVYEGSGMTLLQLLVDFRNYSYTVPAIPGLRVHLSPGGLTQVLIPRSSYSTLMRTISNMDSHVLALGAVFSPEADSHLVCVPSEVEDNSYTTQAISIHDRCRQVTGASFVVLTGGVRHCKSSIVEDGVMVHMSASQLTECLSALKAMRDFLLVCNPPTPGSAENVEMGADSKDEVHFQWTEEGPAAAAHCVAYPRALSWIDGTPLDEADVSQHRAPVSLRQCASNGEHRLIWSQLYVLKLSNGAGDTGEPLDPLQLGQEVAAAVGKALQPHLTALFSHSESARAMALRVRLTADSLLDFDVGTRASDTTAWLRGLCCAELDTELVPLLIDRAGAVSGGGVVTIELEFHVIE